MELVLTFTFLGLVVLVLLFFSSLVWNLLLASIIGLVGILLEVLGWAIENLEKKEV